MGKQAYTGPLERLDEHLWRIPKSYKPGMRVDGLIFANPGMIDQITSDQAPEQVANVTYLPGIQQASIVTEILIGRIKDLPMDSAASSFQ